MHWAPALTMEPGNPPASNVRSAWAAVMIPACVAPILTLIEVPEVGPVLSNVSALVMVILTVRLVFFDRSAASGSR